MTKLGALPFRNLSWYKDIPSETIVSPIERAHGSILSLIGLLSDDHDRAFHAFNRALRSIRPSYVGRTFFHAKMNCKLSDMIQSYIFHFGVWEPEITDVIVRNLAPGELFVDIGANVGYNSLLAAWRVGPEGKVVAIEASPKTFALLQANLALNDYAKNVRAVQVAVSDRVGKLDLFEFAKHNIGAATTIAGRGGTLVATVEAKPLVDILNPDEIDRVRLIKIDVEGAEPLVLSSILDSLDRFPQTMDLIVETSPEDDVELTRAVFIRMKAAGFHAYMIQNDYRRKRYLSGWPTSPIVGCDTLPDRQCDLLYTRRVLAPVA